MLTIVRESTATRRIALGLALLILWVGLGQALPRGLPIGVVALGVVFGSLYALVAIGIVLIYRANRVVNFAQAEFGGIAAVCSIQFVRVWQWNYFQAIAAGVLIAGVIGGLVSTLIIRRFRTAPRLILAVATIGISQILSGAALILQNLFGPPAQTGISALQSRFGAPIKTSFTINPVIFYGDHVIAIIVVPLVLAGLVALLRYTNYGIAIRASAENGDRANLLGIPVTRLATVVWVIAAVLSALTVVLRVPIVGFTSLNSVTGGGNSLLLRTLAAAVIGRMENLPRTVIAAIGLGVFQELASWTWSNTDFVDAMLVVVILGALLLQRDFFFSRGAAAQESSTWQAVREVRPIPAELRRLPEVRVALSVLKLGLIAVAVGLPFWASPSQEQAAALVLIYSIVAVSLLVLTGWAGHISLGQFALAGFGAATTAVLYEKVGWDFFLAACGGIVVAALVALIIGLPALRIKGPFLAVTTLAFAVTSSSFFLEDRYFPWFITPSIERPVLWARFALAEDWKVYYICLAGLMIALIGVRNIRRSRTGRALIAIRDNDAAASVSGINTTRQKLIAFVISGSLAGFAGALYVLHQKGVYTGSFDAGVSVRLFSMVVIGGLGSLPGAVLGAMYVRGAEFLLPKSYALITSGGGILVLLMFMPEGLGGIMYRIRDTGLRFVARRRKILVPSLVADARDAASVSTGRERGVEFLREMAEQMEKGRASALGAAGAAPEPTIQIDLDAQESVDSTTSSNGTTNGEAKPTRTRAKATAGRGERS